MHCCADSFEKGMTEHQEGFRAWNLLVPEIIKPG